MNTKNMYKSLISFLVGLFLSLTLRAQTPISYHPGAIKQKLDKLDVLGSVLYVAAHPDDENTRLITYYANEKQMRTAYLSATRGDGGQNLIGSEIREQLGVIRTQELLAARSVDGGSQFFSRANDFGYSKNPEETFTIWDREKVLADFVWVFRKFRPDVVITRFNSEGISHGHHTASAILAREAFELAGDPNAFPEQLDWVSPWQSKKIFWNTGWWWFRNNPESDTTGLVRINMGKYNPQLGASYGELAARSRSMHKSQGFGSAGVRGDQIEYLKQWAGPKGKNPFDGINTSWDRIEGAEQVQFYIDKAKAAFDVNRPSAITEYLVLARKELNKLTEDFWVPIKKKEIDELILATTGLYLSLSANDDFFVPGDSMELDLEIVNRSSVPIKAVDLRFNEWMDPIEMGAYLLENKPLKTQLSVSMPAARDYTNPYWLREEGTLGMYAVADQLTIGKPENEPAMTGIISLDINGEIIKTTVPVYFRKTDPVAGEVVMPVSVGPPVMINLDEEVMVFGDDAQKLLSVTVIAGKDEVQGALTLDLPEGWSTSPDAIPFSLAKKEEEQVFTFEIVPPKEGSEGILQVAASVEEKTFTKSRVVIDYAHIPRQVIYPEATLKLVRLDLERKKSTVGYIMGAGDAIPQNLRQLGYTVHILDKEAVVAEKLSRYDAIILGVRAFNTVPWLAFKNKTLFEYVKEGGNLIVQYNTNRRLVTQEVAPFDLTISRDRVTVEKAPITPLAEDHPVLNTPNKITQKDFDGWVQERGLYFPNEWSDAFVPILSSNDPGETPKEGGLLVANYGKGTYIYTGYSWFRELPAGVAGAYRLFINLIELEND